MTMALSVTARLSGMLGVEVVGGGVQVGDTSLSAFGLTRARSPASRTAVTLFSSRGNLAYVHDLLARVNSNEVSEGELAGEFYIAGDFEQNFIHEIKIIALAAAGEADRIKGSGVFGVDDHTV